MCLLLSLGTQNPLKEIAWDEADHQFYLETLKDPEIQKELGTPFVYSVNSRQGCGCGFYYAYEYYYKESEEEKDRIEKGSYIDDFKKLKGLIANMNEDPIRLMVMQGNFNPKWTFQRREVSLAQFEMAHLRETYYFETPIIYILRKGKN